MTVLIWLIIMIIFLIAEAVTVGLATIWFAAWGSVPWDLEPLHSLWYFLLSLWYF